MCVSLVGDLGSKVRMPADKICLLSERKSKGMFNKKKTTAVWTLDQNLK